MKLIKNISAKVKEKHGASGYIEMGVLLLVFMMLTTYGASYIQIYAKGSRVDAMAREIARYVELKGEVDSETYAEFDRLKRAAGYLDATVTFDRTGRIPLEATFTVTVSAPDKFGIGGIQVIPINVKAVATGRGEKYWK